MEVFVPRQTIIGLYIQLHEDGYSDDDLKSIQRVYRLAALMFAGQYRRNEKPAACHMVGTASAMAHFDRRLDLVAAGMLHAALDFGLFPEGMRYAHSFQVQVAETALANATGSVEQRLARSILMYGDLATEEPLSITHEELAAAIAVRRASVTRHCIGSKVTAQFARAVAA